MWLFGLTQHIFPDPLWAGRLVSVIFGGITLSGIYATAKMLLSKQKAFIAAFFYCIIPLSVFYDRMALMESAVGCIFIWLLYTFFALLKTEQNKYTYLLGFVAGIGFFIKSTPLLFFGVLLLFLFGIGYFDNRTKLLGAACISIGIFVFVSLLLFINPQFWITLPLSSRYTVSPLELLSSPSSVVKTIFQNGHTLLFLVTPIVISSILIGLIRMYKKGGYTMLYVIIILVSLGIETFTIRSPLPRYLAPFVVPFFLPLAAGIVCKKTFSTSLFFICAAILPLCITSVMLFAPLTFARIAATATPSLDGVLQSGHTNGYGISEVVTFLEAERKRKNILITYAQNTGNPESAIIVYFQKKGIPTSYFDNSLVGITDPKVTCLLFPNQTIYFVSRNDQRVGLDTFLVLVKKFPKPEGNDFIGIYTLKTNCKKGKTQKIYLQKNY
jgi:4-amino-4-deoxy-L-arabinose transferase-like glycosyltransferase